MPVSKKYLCSGLSKHKHRSRELYVRTLRKKDV